MECFFGTYLQIYIYRLKQEFSNVKAILLLTKKNVPMLSCYLTLKFAEKSV